MLSPETMPTYDATAARATLEELRQLEREIAELAHVRRSDALARARDAVRRIGEVGSPDGILDRAADELGASSDFDRVLISRLGDDVLTPYAIWERGPGAEAALPAGGKPLKLTYPLVEAEVAKRQDARVVDVAASATRSPEALREAFGWRHYVVVALTLQGNTIGLLHADATRSRRAVDELDRDVARLYAAGLAGAFEVAVLRHTLRRHRDEQWSAVRWMSGRLEEADAAEPLGQDFADPTPDLLTPREREVVELLAQGLTNRAISRTLVISEGTAKYHVKNVLRKLCATSRADAVARYLRSRG